MNYLEYWQSKGLDYIVPPGTDDAEGFDVGEVLNRVLAGRVLEVGCGTGRIAKMLAPKRYLGIDINPAAIKVAKEACPEHKFSEHSIDAPLPKCDTILFYTVCLHIPDDLIAQQLRRAADVAKRIVIAEIMNPKYREMRDPSLDYDISNQRSLETYAKLMDTEGFVLRTHHVRPYKFYPGEDMTFAVFQKKDEPK